MSFLDFASGKKERDGEIALQMLADGESTAKICKCTGLTGEQVEALKKQD